MKWNFTQFIFIGILFTLTASCKKDKTDTSADTALFNEVTAGGFTFYQNGNILSAAAPSPHGSFKLRFNATAAGVLDSTGEFPAGNSFPAGALIVKEVYSGTSLRMYAVMKKDPSNGNAGNGWVWAELNTDGSTEFSTGKKGDGCISCHSGSPNRDLTRTFDLH
jgi:hypothetical protein